jgi:uncharacterized protein YceH (UPF0502 family)
MELTPVQVRVLGVLVEKEATTPDQYPLSTNSLTLGCNQKNNRDPLTSYTDREIDAVMLDLRAAGLARTVHAAGARVAKHKHVLDEAWDLDARQLAVLAVLMLRGPNTLNELHARTERYVGFESADDVRATVRTLETRDQPMVVELPRQAGQRETRFTHLLGGEPALGAAPGGAEATVDGGARSRDASPTGRPSGGGPGPRGDAGDLAEQVASLRADVADLNARFEELCRRLGEAL